jgi:hypothetical protein
MDYSAHCTVAPHYRLLCLLHCRTTLKTIVLSKHVIVHTAKKKNSCGAKVDCRQLHSRWVNVGQPLVNRLQLTILHRFVNCVHASVWCVRPQTEFVDQLERAVRDNAARAQAEIRKQERRQKEAAYKLQKVLYCCNSVLNTYAHHTCSLHDVCTMRHDVLLYYAALSTVFFAV